MSEVTQTPKVVPTVPLTQEERYELFLKGLKDSTMVEVPSIDYETSTWIIKDADEAASLGYLFSELLGGKVMWFRPVMTPKYPKVFSFNLRDLFQNHDLTFTINGMTSKFVVQGDRYVELTSKLIISIGHARKKLKERLEKEPDARLDLYREYNNTINYEIKCRCQQDGVDPVSLIGVINHWRPDYNRRFRLVVPSDKQEEFNNNFLHQSNTIGCGVFDFKGDNIGVTSNVICKGNVWLVDVELVTPSNEVMYPDYLFGGETDIFTNALQSVTTYLELVHKDGKYWFELRTIEQ